MAILRLILPSLLILLIRTVSIHCEMCKTIYPFAEVSTSSFKVDFETVPVDDIDHSYDLRANFSWENPQGTGYDQFMVRSVKADGELYSSRLNCEDDTYIYVIDTFAVFNNLQHGSLYAFQVGLYDSTSHGAQQFAKEFASKAPDCYLETSDLNYCASRDIATIGVPVDVRTEDIIKYQDTNHTVTIHVTWRRPVQINGLLTYFLLKVDNEQGTLFNKLLEVDKVYAEGPDVTFYIYIPTIPEGKDTNLRVTAYVYQEGHVSSIPGPEHRVSFLTIPTFNVTVARPTGLDSPGVQIKPTRTPPQSPHVDSTTSRVQVFLTDALTDAPRETSPFIQTTPLSPDQGQSEWIKVLLYSGVPALVLTCCIAAILVRFRRKRSKSSDETLFIRYLENGNSDKPPTPKVKRPSIDLTPKDPAFEGKEFDRSLLKIEKELGAGQFGIVYKAFAFGLNGIKEYVPVAVKSLRVNATPGMEEDFLNEIKLMIDLGQHPNILQIIGCCTVHEPNYLITEYMKYGDLLHFLWKCREDKYRRQDSIFDLTQANQLQICRQISRGMEYIFKTRYYHGDLAARNVLVGEGLEVKVSDFGLADDIYQSGYKRLAPDKKRPVKWVSLETNTIGRCTIQSDVWSFGIVMYEIYTLGGVPYPGMDGREIISKLQEGYRMPKPDQCPEDVYDIMKACWHANPSERPTFTTIFKRLDDMLAVDSDYLTADFDDVQQFSSTTAPSHDDKRTVGQNFTGEDVNMSTLDKRNEDEEEEEEEDDLGKMTDSVAMEPTSMETAMGQGNPGFLMEEEECSVSIKRDNRIVLDPREHGMGITEVVSGRV
ncbi:putative neurotrophin receptor LTRK 1 [Strongylocentrotus purpuratus]|uniref:Protein kinase domain-containing protein n=1 Tax=Strongylocentrotus purpuratus TaxID=7668 RepID=A0A7M7HM58_STRPU|nr:putative neurotrophin receptor LTRK 1 [Strongylocentrotus purpuratus]